MQIKELYSHVTNDITVYVEIDYPNNKISLMEPVGNGTYKEKKWLFAGRGREYMRGWKNILKAMDKAIDDAENKLSLYIAERTKKKEEEIIELGMLDIKPKQ